MKIPLLLLGFLIFAMFSSSAAAQRGGGSGGRGPGVSPRTRTMTPPDTTGTQGNVFLSGKVVLDDGSPLTEGASIQTTCKGQKRTETYTDSTGSFSFQFASLPSMNSGMGLGDADTTSWVGTTSRGSQRTLQDCELSATLPGFTSEVVELSRVAGDQSVDIGRVVLHRLAQVEGLTISATSAAAPDSARKAFEKGMKQESKKKLDDAQQSFEKAVGIYARYAVAWYELGRIQSQKNDFIAAHHSFDQALAADSRFVSPYRGLAQLAVREKQWPVVIEQTGKLLALNPINFPDVWLLNSAAHYFLHDLDAAEKSARQGMKLDEEHHFPRFEYLLGIILVEKHNYPEAADHVRKYIALATSQPEIEAGKNELAQIQALSPNSNAVAEKK